MTRIYGMVLKKRLPTNYLYIKYFLLTYKLTRVCSFIFFFNADVTRDLINLSFDVLSKRLSLRSLIRDRVKIDTSSPLLINI